jgi:general secretion pathway protein M
MKFKQWFNNFNTREQLMMVMGGAAVIVYLGYVLLWNPLAISQKNLKIQNQQATETLQKVEALAAQYKKLKQSGLSSKKGSGQSLSQIIDTSVARNQLKMKRFQPSSSGDAQVRFENAEFNHIIAWLYDLENGYGLIVKDLSVTPSNISGYVDVSVRLSQGS